MGTPVDTSLTILSRMSSPALRIRGLCKAFGTFQAVDNVDLTVAPGTFHGIVGPNGAGKSTTIGMAVGLVVPEPAWRWSPSEEPCY